MWTVDRTVCSAQRRQGNAHKIRASWSYAGLLLDNVIHVMSTPSECETASITNMMSPCLRWRWRTPLRLQRTHTDDSVILLSGIVRRKAGVRIFGVVFASGRHTSSPNSVFESSRTRLAAGVDEPGATGIRSGCVCWVRFAFRLLEYFVIHIREV